MQWTRDHAPEDLAGVIGYGRAMFAWAIRAGWNSGLLARSDAVLSTAPDASDIEKLVTWVDQQDLRAPAPARRPPDAVVAPETPRIARLARSIGGGGLTSGVLATLLAIEIDPVARTLAGYARGGAPGTAPSVGTLMMLFGEALAPEILVALGDGAPLRRHRLVELTERAGDTFAAATVRAAPRLVRWLVLDRDLDGAFSGEAQVIAPTAAPVLPPAAVAALEDRIEEVRAFLASRRGDDNPGDFILRGPRGVGRGEIAREACRRLELPLLAVDAEALLGRAGSAELGGVVLREALLIGAQLLITRGEALTGDRGQALRAELGSSSQPILIACDSLELPRLGVGRTMIVRDIGIPETHRREAIWSEVLSEVPAGELASLYRVGAGAIARLATTARLEARVRGSNVATTEDVARGVRNEFASDLGTVAQRINVSQTWDDLVLPPDLLRTLREIGNQLRHRSTVLGRWGFARKLGKGVGTIALFSGQPGTGKSMAAGLIARDLGLDLYQIDLSRVMSKWIGETEKNLARAFDAAETGHVVLLFDEADALLGKRSVDPKSAGERFANVEVNYMLSRLESFHGIAIMTTNLEGGIDPALTRRLSFDIRFPFPDESLRAELWKRMLPAETPIQGKVDFDTLAKRFELSGGYIRNIVLRAAYLAAAEGRSLGNDYLMRAVEAEYHGRGMLVARGRLVD
ncbi:MAG: ATPase central domain protein [Myxococcales bacterium]|nr:ATPase central domain protein [Myxococcales bacterium]